MSSTGPGILLRATDLLPLSSSVSDSSIAVMGGSVLALLCDDAAFPSRLAGMLAGAEKPWGGRITAGRRGIPVTDRAARKLIGFVKPPPAGPGDMTPSGVLTLAASAARVMPARTSRAVREMIDWCGLGSSAGTRLDGLDPGSAFATAFASALMHNPSVLIVEPLVPEAFFPHLEAIKNAGKAIVLTGRGLDGIPPCTDRVALCTPTDIARTIVRTELVEMTAGACEIRVSFCPAIPRRLIEEMPGMEILRGTDSGFSLRHRTPLSAVSWLLSLARANSRTIVDLEIRPPCVADLIAMTEPGSVLTLFDYGGEE